MVDSFSPDKRKEIMSLVKNKNTAPEMAVRKLLHGLGFRFRLHVAHLPGKPDIVLPRFKTVVLVHGCFWHGHSNCSRAKLPDTRRKFWEAKIEKNHRRDAGVISRLNDLGYSVHVVWQCEVPGYIRRPESLKRLIASH